MMLGSLVGSTELLAQNRIREEKIENLPKVLVGTFDGDKDAAVKIATAIRAAIEEQQGRRKWIMVIDGDAIDKSLRASDFPTTEHLKSYELKSLASILRADWIIDGSVTKGNGYHVAARILLARDPEFSQPLPEFDKGSIEDAAGEVARQFEKAQPQLDAYNKCYTLEREGRHVDALNAASKAMKDYPNAVLTRLCAAEVVRGFARDKVVPHDSLLSIVNEIRKHDPKSKQALRWAAEGYAAKGDTAKRLEALMALQAVDPEDQSLQSDVITGLAQSGQFDKSAKYVEDALRNSPGDPALLLQAWKIYFAQKEWDKFLKTSEELAKADTSIVNKEFFDRQIQAYQELKQTDKLPSVYEKAVAKYPNDARLWLEYGQTLKEAGKTAEALVAFQKSIAIDPKLENSYAVKLIVQAYATSADAKPDSVITLAQWGAKTTGDANTFSLLAMQAANKVLKAANDMKTANDPKNVDEFRRAIRYLGAADSIKANPTAKAFMVISYYQIAFGLLTDAAKTKDCEMAKGAKDALDKIPGLVAGTTGAPDQVAGSVKQINDALPELNKTAENQLKQFCGTAKGTKKP
jgi:tetratricopeptide (TPR) repeat protein